MRKSANVLIPATLISLYYALCFGLALFLLHNFPQFQAYFPVGGLSDLAELAAQRDTDVFEPVYSSVEDSVLSNTGPVRLIFACISAAIVIVPVTWVYFITVRSKEVDQSFAQTIVIMPIVITGIAMIVVNSIALAFSLAGIVAAVRFRFALREPAHAMYIFVAIGVGLAAGIGAPGVAMVISAAFVYVTLAIWKLEYGQNMSGSFLSMLTRRNRAEEEF